MGVSRRRLPDLLAEAKKYHEIVILGIGLNAAPPLLANVLKMLTAQGTKVVWISALDLPRSFGADIRGNLEIHVDHDVDHLFEAVGKVYGVACDDLAPILQEKKPAAKVQRIQRLLDAAMYMYRNYQDEIAYANAIRHVAAGEDESLWTAAERDMVEHFQRFGNRELVGKSAAVQNLLGQINLIAPKDRARVLICGESGTGKETVALQIHNKSPRLKEPFIAFNCANVSPELLESRFLGHEKGAFTGANERKRGIFEQANGGTLFLDEIGELPLAAQGLLLRVLEGGRFTRMGEKEEVVVDVRLLAATHRNLAAMVRDSRFREDLFFRLNVIQIRVPPLREHKEDVAQIADGFWLKRHGKRLKPDQIEALMDHDYPGNVRELLNLLERASVLEVTDFAQLVAEHKKMSVSLATDGERVYPDNLEEMTRLHVRRVYNKCGKNLTKTAETLGAARNTVRKYLDLSRADF